MLFSSKQNGRGSFLALLIVLGGALAFLCHDAFLPNRVHWANDVPLGAMLDSSDRLPGTFAGHWTPLYWIGGATPSSSPAFSTLLQTVFSPEMYLKIFMPLSMFLLGLGAWFFCRQLGFAPAVCVICGLGAGLNMHYFSNGTWGLGNWAVSASMVLVSLGVIVSPNIKPAWVKAALSGLAVGMVVMEGFDAGAIMSLYAGVFIVFFLLAESANPVKGIVRTVAMGTVVVLFALLISLSTLYTLVGTQIKGTATLGPSAEADAKQMAKFQEKKSAGTLTAAEQSDWDHLRKVASADSGLVIELRAKAANGSLTPAEQSDLNHMEQILGERKARWDFTTQWSFPKMETLRLFIPGLYGYRLMDYTTDTNKAGVYWGSISEDPRITEMESGNADLRIEGAHGMGLSPDEISIMAGNNTAARKQIVEQQKGRGVQLRHTGSGDYTGLLVCLLAVFGLFNSFRKSGSPYSRVERDSVWFWAVAALISLLACWGRYSGLYQFIYHLPFINNIRSPIKFLHPLNICLIILSGYGLEALHRRYMVTPVNRSEGAMAHAMRWWKKAAGFDKQWVVGSLIFLGASIIGLLVYASSKNDLVHYLTHSGFSPELAPQIADFSFKEVFIFVVLFAASTAVIIGILSGAWTGNKAIWAWSFLGIIMFVDLSRADAPWVRYYDVKQKYSMNPVVDFLRHEPWEHRVMSRFLPTGGYIPGEGYLGGLCHWWLENDYLANNIQSLEIDQRAMPDLDKNYINAFNPKGQQDIASPVRLWRLTNTRYIFADANVTPALNQLADPPNGFHDVMRMDVVRKPNVDQIEDAGDLTVQPNENGKIALIEFTQALPRAKLYANWQATEDKETLAKLDSSEFDPTKLVLIATNTPVGQNPANPDADPGTVKITDYLPKDVKLTAEAKTPAVLMLNDRTGEYWNVWVDDKPANLLRCNYIMRGVFLTPGHHTIEFKFQAPLQWLYVSLGAFGAGVLLTGYVVVARIARKRSSSQVGKSGKS